MAACFIIFRIASKFISLPLVLVIFAALSGVILLLRGRRVCCYLCRGGLQQGSYIYTIDNRRRLICAECERVNAIYRDSKLKDGQTN